MFIKSISSKNYATPRFFFYLGLLSIGQTILRPALSFTLSDWFFLISFLLTTSESLLRKHLEINFPPYMILGLYLFTIGGIVSSCFALMPFMSLIALIKYLYLIAVWFWLSTILLQTLKQIQTSIFLWTFSAALSGFGSLIQIVWNDIIPGVSPAWGRMTGFTEHVNDLGGLTSVALIPAIILMTSFPKKICWLFISATNAILITAGLVLSVSMSGISALLASFLTWIAISKFSLKKGFIISLSTVLFFTVILIQGHFDGVSVISRFSEISYEGLSIETLQTRLDTYIAAWEVISESPIIGVGMGPNVGFTNTGHVVHNIFLLNWYESGFFGFIGIIIILGSIALQASKGLRNPLLEKERMIGLALFSSYIAFLVLGIAQPIYYKRFGWISSALLLALYTGRKNKQNSQEIGDMYKAKKHND